jgi:hypothetical protein
MNILLKLKNIGNNIGNYFSEDGLAAFDFKTVLLFMVSALFFVFLVGFKIHGSSVSVWNEIIRDGSIKDGIVIGTPKGIRSDEWLVSTPLTLSEVSEGFKVSNPNVGNNTDPLLMNMPVKHPIIILRPQFWGYFFLDTERAFSFYWNVKVFGSFFSIFLLLMILTRGNFWLSGMGSLWVFFSGFVQWWFSTSLPDMLFAFGLLIISLSFLLFSKKKQNIILSSVFLTLSGINFILTFYPPFLIPLIYLLIFILIGLVLRDYKKYIEYFKSNFRLRIGMISLSALVSFTFSALFYISARPTIQALLSTAYPGKRLALGGEGGAELFSAFFSNFYNYKHIPLSLGNICEASNFLLLFPIIFFIIFVARLQRKKVDPMLLSLSMYLILITSWALFYMHPFLAKITLMNNVQTKRGFIGIGIASIFLVVTYLSQRQKILLSKIQKLLLILAVVVSSLLYSVNFNQFSHYFFSQKQIMFIVLFLVAVTLLIIYNRKYLAMIVILIFVILPHYDVNPISQGLGPIKNKKISKFIRENKDNQIDGEWVVYGSFVYANFFKASGADVFNGVKYTPDLKDLKVLDVEKKYDFVYNRYAHIDVQEPNNEPGKKEDLFVLRQPDLYTINVDPCSDKIKKIGIKNIAFSYEPKKSSLTCLRPIMDAPIDGIWLYKVKLVNEKAKH